MTALAAGPQNTSAATVVRYTPYNLPYEYKMYNEVKTFANSPHTFCFFRAWFNRVAVTIDQFIQKAVPRK